MLGAGYNIDDAIRQAVELHLEQTNKEGGINGQKINLRLFADNNDKRQALRTAYDIAKTDVLLMIGHNWSANSIPAGKVYQKKGIPAITGSAMAAEVTMGNDVYFRTVCDTTHQAKYAAHYIKKILKFKKASLIYSNKDDFSLNFARNFADAARRVGIEIQNKWIIDEEKDLDQELKRIVHEIRALEDPGILFFSMLHYISEKLVVLLKKGGSDYPIMLPYPLQDEHFEHFNSYPQAQARPGFFTDGIYAVSPIIIDIANKTAHEFKKKYVKKYGMEPGWNGATHYDAIMVAVEAMKRADIQGAGYTRRDRRAIIEALGRMNSINAGVKGTQGNIYFNENGDSNASIAMGSYYKQMFFPTFVQHQLKGDAGEEKEEDAVKKALEGDIILIRNRVLAETNIVYTGIDINEIKRLDMENSIFNVDFYIWFTFMGEFDPENIVFLNSVNPIQLNKTLVEKKQNALTTVTYQVIADFKTASDFHYFPFDKRMLSIKFRHEKLTRDKLVFVYDAFAMSKAKTEFEKKGGATEISDDKGWYIREKSFYEDILTNVSSLGMEEALYSDNIINYSKINAVLTIEKQKIHIIIRYFVPIIILFVMLYSIYFIRAENFIVKILIAGAALISIVIYHASIILKLGVDYIVALEFLYFVLYALISIGVVLLFMIDRYYKKGSMKKVKILRYCGIGMHTLAGLGTFFWYLAYYSGR